MTALSETLNIELREGLRLVFAADYPLALHEMYVLTVGISSMLDGKSVACVNFLPGVTLDIESRWRVEDGLPELVREWQDFQAFLSDWVDQPSVACAALLGYSAFELSRSNTIPRTPPPTVEIVRKFAWGELQERRNLSPDPHHTK